MIRVLQCVNNMDRAGLETMLMNYYRNIDRERFQFDFLMHRREKSEYDDEITALGGKIFRAPRLYPQNYKAYFAYMRHFFAEHPEYKIVHSHIDAMSYLPLLAAKKAGIAIRIAHSHSTSIDLDMKMPLKQFFRYRINTAANYRCACGKKAGEFLFGKRKFTIIPNAIDTDKYLFDERTRYEKRCELGIENKFVVGHVGRISYPKNHIFLIDIFHEIKKQCPHSVLLLAGSGEKETAVRQHVAKLALDDSVRFLGVRRDVYELYQAMDVFVMPSRFEGIPVVGIEAQFSGLTCLFSDRVSEEVAFTDSCCFIKLNRSVQEWAKTALICRNDRNIKIISDKYDIRKAHTALENYYEALMADCGDESLQSKSQ